MSQKIFFLNYLNQQLDLSEEEADYFFNILSTKKYKKNETILKRDSICTNQYFITKGVLVAYEIDKKGEEHVIQIGIENSWIGDLESYTRNIKCNRIIKAECDCELLLLDQINYSKLLEHFPVFEKLFRILFQNAYIHQTQRVSMMLKTDMKSRIKYFFEHNKNTIAKVELKVISSYLGMSPETLSRLKRSLDINQV